MIENLIKNLVQEKISEIEQKITDVANNIQISNLSITTSQIEVKQ